MELSEQQQELSRQIEQWMWSCPDQEQILEYYRKFPENQKAIISETCTNLLIRCRVAQEKIFKKHLLYSLLTKYSFSERLNLIAECALGNSEIGVRQLVSRASLDIDTFNQADFVNDATNFLALWDRILVLASAAQLQQFEQYLSPIIKQLSQKNNLEELLKFGEEATTALSLEEENYALSAVSFLSKFSFLPELAINDYVTKKSHGELGLLYVALITVLLAIKECGQFIVQGIMPIASQNLIGLLKVEQSRIALSFLDGQFFEDQPELIAYEKTYIFLYGMWTPEHYLGQSFSTDFLNTITSQISISQRVPFYELLTDFLLHFVDIQQYFKEQNIAGIVQYAIKGDELIMEKMTDRQKDLYKKIRHIYSILNTDEKNQILTKFL